MKLTISKNDLLNALTIVSGTASSKPILPIGEYAKLDAKDGKLTFFTTDYQSSTVHSIDCDGEALSVLLPVRWFIEFLKEMGEQPVIIEMAGNMLSINGQYEIPTEDVKDFAVMPKAGEELFKTSANDLKAALFAVSDNELTPQFTGVAISEKTIRASNMHILYSASHTGYTGEQVMFPKRILQILPDGEYSVSLTKNSVCFFNETTAYHTKLQDVKLPDYNSVIPNEQPIHFQFDRLQLLSALKRLRLFANQVKQSVRFEFTNAGLSLSASDVDFSKKGSEKIIGTLIGEDITIAFNGVFMATILSEMGGDTAYLSMASHNRGAVLRETENNTDIENLVLIMPCVL